MLSMLASPGQCRGQLTPTTTWPCSDEAIWPSCRRRWQLATTIDDDGSKVRRQIVVRHRFGWGHRRTSCGGCCDRNIGFSVTARIERPRSKRAIARPSHEDATALEARPCAKMASGARAPRWPRSATWSTPRSGRRTPGSSSGVSRFTPGPSRACSRASSTATGATTPTSKGNPVARDVFTPGPCPRGGPHRALEGLGPRNVFPSPT